LLKQIENDKLERAARAGKLPSQSGPAAAKPCSSPADVTVAHRSSGSGNSTRLCFRLQDGSSLKEQFDMKQTYYSHIPPPFHKCDCIYNISHTASATCSSGSIAEFLQGLFQHPIPLCHLCCLFRFTLSSPFTRQYSLLRHLPATSYARGDSTTLEAAGTSCRIPASPLLFAFRRDCPCCLLFVVIAPAVCFSS
jgi:hypothetical protein